MYIKLLILSQLLALSIAHSKDVGADVSTYSDEESLDDVHLPDKHYKPETTTVQPEIVPDNGATAQPDDDLQSLGDGLLQNNDGLAFPITTTTTTEVPETTTTTTTTTTPKPPKHEPKPHAHPHDEHHSLPYPYPYPSLVFKSATGPKPESSDPKTEKDVALPSSPLSPGYPSYPGFRSPYSPYPLPNFPGYGPGPGYGHNYRHPYHHHSHDEDEDDKKPEEGKEDDNKSSEEEPEDVPLKPPGFGYPPVYIVQRPRPVPHIVTGYPSFGRGGYGSPYGYGRY